MTVSTGAALKSLFNSTTALGDKAVSSDATFEIKGAEDISLLIKQFPWPELTVGGEIEVPMPLGSMMYQPQQAKTAQQGQISFMETVDGHIAQFLERIVASGGKFNATVYEGTPDNYKRKCDIFQCFFQGDNPDRDWENRQQILLVSGSLFFHFFGSSEA